jgi:glycosyltransferase involved in cell wall biosynthesis
MNLPPIICLSTIDWNFQWQRHQILMSAFAAMGTPVLFVENMGGRPPGAKDLGRIWQRLHNLSRQWLHGPRQVNGVTVVSPAIMPFPSAKFINEYSLKLLARRSRQLGFINPLVWTYSPVPLAMKLVEYLTPRFLVYDCVSSIKGYAYVTPELIASEDDLIRRADLILTDGQTLFHEKAAINPNTDLIAPGVNYEQFAVAGQRPEPADIAGLPRPRLGFFGTLGWWVDYDLLRSFAVSHPDWSVVMIGPVKADVTLLNELTNVQFLGVKRHSELPAYLQALDVLTMPYVVNEFTRGVMPAKLFEALASGKPVVSTAIPEMTAYQDIVRVTDQQGFNAAIENAFANDMPALRKARLDMARENSWSSRLERIFDLLSEALPLKD